jgi:hypothetical protein
MITVSRKPNLRLAAMADVYAASRRAEKLAGPRR